MMGPVITRGIIEVIRVGSPVAFVAGILNAFLSGELRSGWEFRITLGAILMAFFWFGCGYLLRNWAWLQKVSIEGSEKHRA